MLHDRAIALVDDAVEASQIDDDRARAQLEAAQAELEAIDRGESTADRWQVEQRIKHAENQLDGRGALAYAPRALAAAADGREPGQAVVARLERPELKKSERLTVRLEAAGLVDRAQRAREAALVVEARDQHASSGRACRTARRDREPADVAEPAGHRVALDHRDVLRARRRRR